MRNWFRRKTKESDPVAAFWQWFAAEEGALRKLPMERVAQLPPPIRELRAALQRVHPSVTWVMGDTEDGRRELIVSADGILEAFPAVHAICDAAPPLPAWVVTRFRPRWPEISPIEMDGVRLDPADVRVLLSPDPNPDKLTATIFLPAHDPAQDRQYRSIAMLFLDYCLGEYDVETRLGVLRFRTPTDEGYAEAEPVPGLAERFDRAWANRERER